MLKHLAEGFPGAVAKLTMQYRMNEDICHLSNLIGARMNPYDIVYNVDLFYPYLILLISLTPSLQGAIEMR